MNFKNKRILITGGTSGLGQAFALELAREGAKVAIVARNEVALKHTIQKAAPAEIVGIQADISQKNDVYRISGEASALLGGIDILINNASFLGTTPLRLLIDTECEDFEQVMQTNLLGPFRLTKAVLPGMILRQNGIILNISSDAAINPYPKWGAYGTSKAALAHLTRIWNEELKDQNIRFFSLDPGDLNTPLHFAAIPDADASKLLDPRDAALKIMKILE